MHLVVLDHPLFADTTPDNTVIFFFILFTTMKQLYVFSVILDSAGSDCQNVNFNIGGSTSTTRQWDIFVTQYTCGQEDLGGPPGCLQYYTGTTGLVKK